MDDYDQTGNSNDDIPIDDNTGAQLIQKLKTQLAPGSSLLELGMGSGKDLNLLSQSYVATGSDYSQDLLDCYLRRFPKADLILLNALTIQTNRKFDGIYSNKVLYQLTPFELKKSLVQQHRILSSQGILMHSFWYGNHVEDYHGTICTYYTEKTLTENISERFELLDVQKYREVREGDSIYILLRKSTNAIRR